MALKRGSIGFLIFIVVCVAEVCCNSQIEHEESLQASAPAEGTPWPMPQMFLPLPGVLSLDDENFMFQATGKACDILYAAFDRYFKLVFYKNRSTKLKFKPAHPIKKAKVVTQLKVNVQQECETYPSLEMDESYQLTIKSDTDAQLNSKSIWGALRGLETFSQLVYDKSDGGYFINCTMIEDFPRFAHRGILLDTSRHFIPKRILLQNLDAMAYNKFNVFHWHIVDDQSFPYQSRIFPELSQMGAYDPYTHIYTQEDIKEIIEYARLRGIRVIPEFDTPGHSQSWGKSMKNLLTKCYSGGQFNGNYGPIDPTVNGTYDFLITLLQELVDVFPDKYLHLGGDEVSFSCWATNPDVAKFMTLKGFGKNYAKLEEYYIQNLLNLIAKIGSQYGYIVWQEVVDNGVKVAPDTVVEVWKGGYQKEMGMVTKLGLRTLLSSPWYLNYISYGSDWAKYYMSEPLDFDASDAIVEVWKSRGAKPFNAEMNRVTKLGLRTIVSECWYLNLISYGSDWMKYYMCDPQRFNGTEAQKKLVIGGEACMWGEYVDGTNVISRTWPRAGAVGERLWSPQKYNSTSEALPRLVEQRCRMLRRGLNAEPFSGPGFCKHEIQ